jgi:hypothetical protein
MAWIKVTNEVREAAQRLLIRHNEAEKARAEKRYQDELARTKSWARELGRGVNKAYIRERAACELPADKDLRQRLEAVAHGKRKLIDVGWWRKVHGDVNRKLVEKIAALADPARNPSEHERKVAEAKLKAAKARRTPGMPPEPLPLPVNLSEWTRKGKTKSPPPPSSRRLSAVSDSVATPSCPAAHVR